VTWYATKLQTKKKQRIANKKLRCGRTVYAGEHRNCYGWEQDGETLQLRSASDPLISTCHTASSVTMKQIYEYPISLPSIEELAIESDDVASYSLATAP
jgi:hypothetical protein